MNPIKDNRIIIDIRFAWRLYHFLMRRYNGEKLTFGDSLDMEYLIYGANRLLAWQKTTATNAEEQLFLSEIISYQKGGNWGSVRLNPDKKNPEQFHCQMEEDNLKYIYEEALRSNSTISEVINRIVREERDKQE